MSLLFSFGMKESTVYSLATIFFSQLSKLCLNAANGTLLAVDLMYLPFVVLPAIAGGFLGTLLNQRAGDEGVRRTYLGIMIALLLLSCYNCAQGTGLL